MKINFATAIQAAVEAGKAILDVYGKDDFEIESKSDQSPLTLADRKAHEIIVSALQETEIPILSEEGQSIPYMNRSWWEQFWLVDPLDGTKEFIKRNGEFTVNIALVKEGKSVFGVVFAPVINQLYIGDPVRGAFLCTDPRHYQQPLDYLLQFSEKLPLKHPDKHIFRVVASRSHFNEETRTFIQGMDTGGRKVSLVNRGSSLKICMVATGEADVYPRLGPTMEWDTAAAHAVVKATGRNIYLAENGLEMEYNKENLLNPYFVVR